MSAPLVIRVLISSSWPYLAATWRGVLPYLSTQSISPPDGERAEEERWEWIKIPLGRRRREKPAQTFSQRSVGRYRFGWGSESVWSVHEWLPCAGGSSLLCSVDGTKKLNLNLHLKCRSEIFRKLLQQQWTEDRFDNSACPTYNKSWKCACLWKWQQLRSFDSACY